jgi:hypothetical protein
MLHRAAPRAPPLAARYRTIAFVLALNIPCFAHRCPEWFVQRRFPFAFRVPRQYQCNNPKENNRNDRQCAGSPGLPPGVHSGI